jgi:hypothetical protein
MLSNLDGCLRWAVFFNWRSSPNFWDTFFHGKSDEHFYKNGLGYILGDFFSQTHLVTLNIM